MYYHDYLKTFKDCPFCLLKNRIIAENKNAILTYNIAPYHKDHLLIIPKRHFEKILDVKPSETKDVYNLEKIGLNILYKLGYDNVSFLVREGKGSGKSISHLHYHIIPNIRLGDVDHKGRKRKILCEKAVKKLFSKIKSITKC